MPEEDSVRYSRIRDTGSSLQHEVVGIKANNLRVEGSLTFANLSSKNGLYIRQITAPPDQETQMFNLIPNKGDSARNMVWIPTVALL